MVNRSLIGELSSAIAVPPQSCGATKKRFNLKILAILALTAASFLPTLPASAGAPCSISGNDNPNHQSSLSSTTAGGNRTCSRVPD